MSKRARYVGPFEEVFVFDPEDERGVYGPPVATVKRGAHLPDDVKARIRNDLVKGDDWLEVDQPSGSRKEGDS
jgi:hypothetical protein